MPKTISNLHYLTQDMPGYDHQQLAEMACAGNVDWVQLRVKEQDYDDWLDTAWEVKKICNKYGAKLIVNDNLEIAVEVGADGVHLGKNDLSPVMARAILGDSKIIGGTANTIDDIKVLNEMGVDYIGLGPFRFTETKKNLSPELGIEGYRKIMDQCRIEKLSIPIIAIGGIKLDDIDCLMVTGISGVAVSSAINKSIDPDETALKFKTKLNSINLADSAAKFR